MNNKFETIGCATACWLGAAALAFLAFLITIVVGGWAFSPSAFVGVVVFLVVGLFTSLVLCPDGLTKATKHASANGPIDAPDVGKGQTVPAATAPMAAPRTPAPAPAAKPAPVVSSEPEFEPEADTVPEPAAVLSRATDKAAQSATKAAAEPVINPSAPLAGQAELASRKGEWSYSADVQAAGKVEGDYDGDGVAEGTSEGTKPATLSAARDGGADDLKRIKGIGPKLEKLCNTLGFYHFDQISAWTADEVAWVDANLEGFKGRVTRDTWVEQATLLATGAETEFSKKVDKGDVY
ncbi:MAG: endonuclease [Sedimentitalea sp.]